MSTYQCIWRCWRLNTARSCYRLCYCYFQTIICILYWILCWLTSCTPSRGIKFCCVFWEWLTISLVLCKESMAHLNLHVAWHCQQSHVPLRVYCCNRVARQVPEDYYEPFDTFAQCNKSYNRFSNPMLVNVSGTRDVMLFEWRSLENTIESDFGFH